MKPRDVDVAVAAAEANTLRRRRRPATDGHSCSEFLFGLMLLITRLSTGFLRGLLGRHTRYASHVHKTDFLPEARKDITEK